MNNKEAIGQLEWVKKRISNITYSPESFEALNLAIKALEERPTGKWLFDAEHSITIDMFKCSVCGSGGHVHFNYCPNCGAKMKKEAENEQTTD